MGSKYKEYAQLDLPKLAEEVRADWEKNDVFAKSLETRKGNEPFVFY